MTENKQNIKYIANNFISIDCYFDKIIKSIKDKTIIISCGSSSWWLELILMP